MLTRSFLLILCISSACILSLTSCARLHHTTPAPSKVYSAPIQNGMQTRIIAPFTRVQVDGNIDVTLYTGDSNPRVILHGDANSLPDVETTVSNGLLHVNVGKGYPHFGRVRIEIHTHYLTSFSYHGMGEIVGNNLQSRMLDLSINNKGKTVLQGKIALRKLTISGSGNTKISGVTGHLCQMKISNKAHVQIDGSLDVASLDMEGNSWISLYWMQSRSLKVRARDHAFIQMAGIADLLDVELWDKARFNGRYLRATRAFIKTHDNSVADVCVLKTQHTLASDASNIYFHNLPNMKADFMAYNGSVLDMRDWDTPAIQEYTRYNR